LLTALERGCACAGLETKFDELTKAVAKQNDQTADLILKSVQMTAQRDLVLKLMVNKPT
jgi:hypothetical protein